MRELKAEGKKKGSFPKNGESALCEKERKTKRRNKTWQILKMFQFFY
jgi:hypothetical protein